VRTRRAVGALFAAATLAIAGCGDDNTSKDSGASSADSSSATANVQRDLQVSTDLKKKPVLTSLSGLPPEKLVTKDIVPGTGAVAKPGDKITVQYVGQAYSTDKEIDSSWGREPLTGTLVSPGVIEGWVKGISGMKVGGRRALVIPPDLAYGDQGQPPDIAPAETLIFVIDLKKIG
jgi:peptidylprolyl isomerase